jgi:cytochrome c nitrite reductase small subunit
MRTRTLASWTVAALIGLSIGVGGFTFFYAQGISYLGHDSAACANCHVMNEQYGGWLRSSHRSVAQCNDCHAPHSLLPKYATKAINGWRHSVAFTTGAFPEPIRITDRNRAVTEGTCRHCHGELTANIESGAPHGGGEVSCIRCHGSVGHPEPSPEGITAARSR